MVQVILLTDADVDGAHIRTLLLTFLFRFARELFVQGHVFVGMPPLYKVVVGRQSHYCHDDQALQARIKGLSPGSYTIQRFKACFPLMPVSRSPVREMMAWTAHDCDP